jgi:hypothetical protein
MRRSDPICVADRRDNVDSSILAKRNRAHSKLLQLPDKVRNGLLGRDGTDDPSTTAAKVRYAHSPIFHLRGGQSSDPAVCRRHVSSRAKNHSLSQTADERNAAHPDSVRAQMAREDRFRVRSAGYRGRSFTGRAGGDICDHASRSMVATSRPTGRQAVTKAEASAPRPCTLSRVGHSAINNIASG